MKFSNLLFLLIACLLGQTAAAQYNRVSHDLGVSVYPDDRQSRATQEYDENKCYDWAYDQERRNEDRYDHRDNYRSEYENDRAERKEENRKVVNKTLTGAAAGTLIGALTGHTGKGLLIGTAGGATVGLLGKGRQRNRYEDRKEEEKRYKDDRLVRNFRACLESKHYSTVQ